MKKNSTAIIVFFHGSLLANTALHSKEDCEAIEQRLQHEEIVAISSFSKTGGAKATHTIKLVTLESGIKALFKTGNYPYAEVAGYRLSKILNLFLVPPTVFRTIHHRMGSLQLYIPARDLSSSSDPSKFLSQIGKEAVQKAQFFYYLGGYWDIHYGNQLIEKTDSGHRIWLIDSASILHRTQSRYGGVTFKEKGSPIGSPLLPCSDFPFEQSASIQGEKAYHLYAPYLSESHRKILAKTSQKYIEWDSTLWIAYETRKLRTFGRYTTTFFKSLLEASKKLTRDDLVSVWSEWLEVDPDSAHQLIDLTLLRRDELLRAALHGRVLEDI
jgi:hypothetical protein